MNFVQKAILRACWQEERYDKHARDRISGRGVRTKISTFRASTAPRPHA
jgi:hypothetical protein